MYNYYDFEAEFPLEKAVQKFLLSDYFHDSHICYVEFDSIRREALIRLQCCRDWENSAKGSLDDPQYTYILHFYGVCGFRNITELRSADYINGRFKNTAWLNEQQKRTKRKVYQYRIEVSDGYLDILFARFSIRKAVGRITYNDITELGAFYKGWYERSPEKINQIRMNLLTNDLCDFHLELLYANSVEDLSMQCRRVLNGEASSDAKNYAAWLLGKCGLKTDLQLIWNRYRTDIEQEDDSGYDHAMNQRNILDAIELLSSLE